MSHVRVDSDPGITAVTEAGRIVMGLNGFSMGDKAATIGHSAGKVGSFNRGLQHIDLCFRIEVDLCHLPYLLPGATA